MCAHAPDSGKDLGEYEQLVEEMSKILRDGRQEGAKRFYIAGDSNIELGLRCTGDDEDEEQYDVYGPQCWQGCDVDLGGFQKLMWYEIV